MGETVDTYLFWGIEFEEDQLNDDVFCVGVDEYADYCKTWRWGSIEVPRKPDDDERQKMIEFLNSILDAEIPEDTEPKLILGHCVC